jgi:hypothetical protein
MVKPFRLVVNIRSDGYKLELVSQEGAVYRSFVANNVHHMVPRRSGVFLLYRGHVDMKVVIPMCHTVSNACQDLLRTILEQFKRVSQRLRYSLSPKKCM